MEFDFGDVNELFGYALPGIAISGLVALFFRRCVPLPLGELAALVGLAALPVGFVWVYTVYHKFFWKHSGYNKWRKFVMDIFNGINLPCHLDQKTSDLLGKMEPERKFNLIDRYFSNIRTRFPQTTFYHVRHHTLRNIGWIMMVVPPLLLAGIVIAKCGFCRCEISLILSSIILGILIILVADLDLNTAIRQFSYVAAQDKKEMIKELTNALQDPFREWIADC